MMLTQQLSSGTVIALSMGELLSMLVVLVSIIGGIIAFVRKDEKDKSRLEQIEKQHAELQVQVAKLTEQMQIMVLHTTPTQHTSRSRKTNGNTT